MGDTIKIKMKETLNGSEDGLTIKTFEKDKTYDMEKSLAENFLKQKKASKVTKAKKKASPKSNAVETKSETLLDKAKNIFNK